MRTDHEWGTLECSDLFVYRHFNMIFLTTSKAGTSALDGLRQPEDRLVSPAQAAPGHGQARPRAVRLKAQRSRWTRPISVASIREPRAAGSTTRASWPSASKCIAAAVRSVAGQNVKRASLEQSLRDYCAP